MRGIWHRGGIPGIRFETRDPAPFLCTYMARSSDGAAPFRVILNQSRAIATNVYLMLYPKASLRRQMAGESRHRKVLASLNSIVDKEWKTSRRVYGGGLYKVEPRELGRLAADGLLAVLPELGSAVRGQMQLGLGGE